MASKWRNRKDGGWECDVYGGVAVIEKKSNGDYGCFVVEPDNIPDQEKLYPFFDEFGADQYSEKVMKQKMTKLCNDYSPENDYICKNRDGVWIPLYREQVKICKKVSNVWKPAAGGQEKFIKSGNFTEVVFGGGRAIGKSTTLLMSFLAHCDIGYGNKWAGYAFFTDSDKLNKFNQICHRWIPKIFPKARYATNNSMWHFEDGETLRLAILRDNYLLVRNPAKDYSWLGFDNMTDWKTNQDYLESFDLLKHNTNKGVPLMLRGTTLFECDEDNEYKPADNWVNNRFKLPINLDTPLVGLLPDTSLGKSISLLTHNSGREMPRFDRKNIPHVR